MRYSTFGITKGAGCHSGAVHNRRQIDIIATHQDGAHVGLRASQVAVHELLYVRACGAHV